MMLKFRAAFSTIALLLLISLATPVATFQKEESIQEELDSLRRGGIVQKTARTRLSDHKNDQTIHLKRQLEDESHGIVDVFAAIFGDENFLNWINTITSMQFLCSSLIPGICGTLRQWANRLEQSLPDLPPVTPTMSPTPRIIPDGVITQGIDRWGTMICRFSFYCPDEDETEAWAELLCTYVGDRYCL